MHDACVCKTNSTENATSLKFTKLRNPNSLLQIQIQSKS